MTPDDREILDLLRSIKDNVDNITILVAMLLGLEIGACIVDVWK